ncbi:MAG: energy-coupling factor transporter transmembrane protein EcfT [Treponema sp.]|nr:energy-coupling factor transporter transmembrane protein EcfT [Treponema sp.]MCL2271915.1 energy-coupling factor transporter transmembrane protein EcfT [Treponema sp.]
MTIYKLDSRIKLLCILLFTVLVFFIDRLPLAICLVLLYFFIRLASGVRIKQMNIWRNAGYLTLLAVFIILMQSLFGPGEKTYVIPFFNGLFGFKREGFFLGLVIVCRLTALILIFPVFTGTSSAYQIATGLHGLGFNYRISFIITTAFNLIPVFRDEASLIMEAQELRGISAFKKGSFPAKIKAYSSLAVPLVLGAMRKAQSTSVAMDSRAFGAYKIRTWLDRTEIKTPDIITIIICLVLCAIFIFFKFYLY